MKKNYIYRDINDQLWIYIGDGKLENKKKSSVPVIFMKNFDNGTIVTISKYKSELMFKEDKLLNNKHL